MHSPQPVREDVFRQTPQERRTRQMPTWIAPQMPTCLPRHSLTTGIQSHLAHSRRVCLAFIHCLPYRPFCVASRGFVSHWRISFAYGFPPTPCSTGIAFTRAPSSTAYHIMAVVKERLWGFDHPDRVVVVHYPAVDRRRVAIAVALQVHCEFACFFAFALDCPWRSFCSSL